MKILTIIGARPQYIKAAALSRALKTLPTNAPDLNIIEVIVNTGQHYDYNMSKVFFEALDIPEPNYHLEVGSGSHGHMTGAMLARIEDVLQREEPDWVLVYGDTNSTLAGALAAAKLHIPVAHVEAGLRSFNRRMPEEINRVLTDHVSTLLFTPTETAVANLQTEGVVAGVINSGDVMLDTYMTHQKSSAEDSNILSEHNLYEGAFSLATVHRQENTDDEKRLVNIFHAFETIAKQNHPIILPLHPRTRKMLIETGINADELKGVRTIEPVGYLEMIQLENNANLIFTDSGGVQKEAYYAGVPCVTLRDETEWLETVEVGANFLAGADADAIVEAYEKALKADVKLSNGLYGDGHAAEKIVETLISES